MQSRFSEFSYGFAITNELVGLSNLHVAPVFPSLIEEGKAGGGYDVKLDQPGIPMFLQFKRSERMMRKSAREKVIALKSRLPLSVPFHRFPITPSDESLQHRSLVELDDGMNAVFYVAPRFHLIEELNAAWAAKQVAARSIYVRPRDIGVFPDAERHTVAFDEHSTLVCSEPKSVQAFTVSHIAALLSERIATDERPVREQVSDWLKAVEEAPRRARSKEKDLQLRMSDVSISTGLPSISSTKVTLTTTSLVPATLSIPIRRAKPLDEIEQRLSKISDEARLNLEAQFFVVQKA